MNQATVIAMLLAVPLVVIGAVSTYWQIRGLRLLRARNRVPQDEFQYLHKRHRRRLLNGVVLMVIGGMIAGAYLSGMEQRADQGRAAFAKNHEEQGEDAKSPPPPTPEERQFFRFWSTYWIIVLVLAFVLIMSATSDAWATRQYGLKIYREMRDEHRARLARDLAVFQQRKSDRFGNRFKGGGEPA
ncbi:MAG: hypothetical protein U0798_04270 [Gemmataceae bacterium]